MLIPDKSSRLSADIDILVEPGRICLPRRSNQKSEMTDLTHLKRPEESHRFFRPTCLDTAPRHA